MEYQTIREPFSDLSQMKEKINRCLALRIYVLAKGLDLSWVFSAD